MEEEAEEETPAEQDDPDNLGNLMMMEEEEDEGIELLYMETAAAEPDGKNSHFLSSIIMLIQQYTNKRFPLSTKHRYFPWGCRNRPQRVDS